MSAGAPTASPVNDFDDESAFSDTSSESAVERVPLSKRLEELSDVEDLLLSSLVEAASALKLLRPTDDVASASDPGVSRSNLFTQHCKSYLSQLEVRATKARRSVHLIA